MIAPGVIAPGNCDKANYCNCRCGTGWKKEHPDWPFPTTTEMLNFRVLHEDKNCAPDRAWAIQLMIWTKILPVCVGRQIWDKNNYYDNTPSGLVVDETGKKRYRIPIAAEAFMNVAWENNLPKFDKQWTDKQNGEEKCK